MATYTGADKAVGYLFTASNNTAAEYSSAATYAAGAFVIHEGTLYKCISAIVTPEDWTPAHWQQTTIMENAGGGGGGGTTVIANPAGAATDTLNKLQVGATIYDVPSGGGGSSHTYSETEQIVGTWIDGKTVYEKTINTGGLPNNTSKNTAHNITNIETIISAAGFAKFPNNNWIPIPFVDNAATGYGQVALIVNATNIIIRTSTDRSSYTDSFVIIRYTKAM